MRQNSGAVFNDQVSFSVPYNLLQRRLYGYINANAFVGGQFFQAIYEIRCVYGETTVGKFPLSIMGNVDGTQIYQSPISVPGLHWSTSNTNSGEDLLQLQVFPPVQANLVEPTQVFMSPLLVTGKIDTITLVRTAFTNVGFCHFWVGCISN